MGAAYFYHLTQAPLEATLPMLLNKALAAGWRVCVRGVATERLAWLDDALWLGPKEAFLPHGLAGGPHDADQPVLLTTQEARPNQAQCVMSVDGAAVSPEEVALLERVCVLFDGNDGVALETARGQWRFLTEAGCAAQYWSQETGRWEMKAQKDPTQ
ncbi:MAG: DNA polymerase III subunit chi [Pseudomonadota bacterium]